MIPKWADREVSNSKEVGELAIDLYKALIVAMEALDLIERTTYEPMTRDQVQSALAQIEALGKSK